MGRMATRDLERLAVLAKKRRLQLGLARNKEAARIGVAKETWLRVEQGNPIREVNYAKIDQALHWAIGSCVAISQGGDPTEIEPGEGGALIAEIPKPDLANAVGDSVTRVLVATETSMSNDEIRQITAEVLEDLQKSGVI